MSDDRGRIALCVDCNRAIIALTGEWVHYVGPRPHDAAPRLGVRDIRWCAPCREFHPVSDARSTDE